MRGWDEDGGGGRGGDEDVDGMRMRKGEEGGEVEVEGGGWWGGGMGRWKGGGWWGWGKRCAGEGGGREVDRRVKER